MMMFGFWERMLREQSKYERKYRVKLVMWASFITGITLTLAVVLLYRYLPII